MIKTMSEVIYEKNRSDWFNNSDDKKDMDYNYTQWVPFYEDTEDPNLTTIFNDYLPPILIILGSIGNILTVLVMRRRVFRKTSIGFYISGYSITSLLTLYLFLGLEWIAHVTHKKTIDNQSDWLCRLWQFIMRVIAYSGIWFIVSMTIDRYIIIWHPWKASSMCSLFMAKFVAVIIFVGLVVISIHAMWTYMLMNGCYPFHHENDLHTLIWQWMSASFYSYIPLTLIFIFDVLIFTGICMKRPSKHTHSNDQVSMILTNTTLALSILYFLIVLPPTVINIVDITFPPSWMQDHNLMLQLSRARLATHYMSYVNTVILFCVCFLFSRTFRSEFFDMFPWVLCHRNNGRIYEIQLGSNSSATQMETDL